jgi:aminopeptidase N
VITAVDIGLSDAVDRALGRTPEIVDFLAEYFGPYPFDALGGIAVGDGRISFALETQSRPIYSRYFFDGGQDPDVIMVHELAHQWFGDSISLYQWRDVWLNEGLATYAEWLWRERHGGPSAQATFDGYVAAATTEFWTVAPGDPGPTNLFHQAVYRRGSMTIQALRTTIGDEAFFGLLREWAHERGGTSATTAQFIETAERVSGQRLGALFDTWLFGKVRPPTPRHGG